MGNNFIFSTNIKVFFQGLKLCIEHILDKYSNIIVIGDININTRDANDPYFRFYKDLLGTFDLKNRVKTNTCFTKSKSSSLDAILTNRPRKFFHTKSTETGISDVHVMVSTLFRAHYKKLDPITISYRDMKRFNKAAFLTDLERENFLSDENLEPCFLAEDTFTKFENVFSKHAPIKQKIIRGNNASFMNRGLS